MNKRSLEESVHAGYDSFLDTVTNIVGILIILVMVVGVRAQHAPVLSIPDQVKSSQPAREDLARRAAELERRAAGLVSIRRDVLELAERAAQLGREILLRQAERDQLALAVALLKKEYEEKAQDLGSLSEDELKLSRELAAAQEEFSRWEAQAAAAQPREEIVTVVNRPTPLSTPSDHEEIHFLIDRGKITYIPLERLIEELTADARRKLHRLLEVPEITGTVGPIGGFKLEYSLVRRQLVESPANGVTMTGAYAQLRQWVLVPVGPAGEPVENALEESSEFRRRLAGYRPGNTTVTLWCYPDGFAAFRRLKDFLHERGYSVAGRPLPEGFPIMGSPSGSKSAAQ